MKHVYAHILPTTGEIIYIGCGSGDRAYSKHHRSKEHRQILDNLERMGFNADLWTVTLLDALPDECAHAEERRLISSIQPLLNVKGSRSPQRGGVRGTAHHNSKLTEALVLQIRARKEQGETYTAIAADVGIHWNNVRKVVKREIWKHI